MQESTREDSATLLDLLLRIFVCKKEMSRPERFRGDVPSLFVELDVRVERSHTVVRLEMGVV